MCVLSLLLLILEDKVGTQTRSITRLFAVPRPYLKYLRLSENSKGPILEHDDPKTGILCVLLTQIQVSYVYSFKRLDPRRLFI